MSWKTFPLRDVVESTQSGFASGEKNVTGGFKHLRMNNIHADGRLDLSLVRTVPQELATTKYRLQQNDVLVCTTNSGKLVGKSAMFNMGGDYAFSNHLTRLRVRRDIADPAFVQKQLWFRWVHGEIEPLCKHWVNQSTLPKDELLGLAVSLPDIDKQSRIVAKLDQVTARIDEAKARLDTIPLTLKRFRQSILAAADSGRLTAEWRKNNLPESADALLARIVKRRKQAYADLVTSAKENGNRKPKQRTGLEIIAINADDLPTIPDSWTYCHLQNLGEFTRGRSKHRPRDDAKLYGGPYPFIQTGDVANSGGRITRHRQTYSEAGLAQSRLFPTGTLCITIAANIADSAILTYPACFPDSVVGLIPDEEFLIEWARYYIQVIQNDLEAYAPATAQKNINMEILELVAVPLPPYQEQVEIVRRVEELFKLADAIEARYKKANAFVEKLTSSVLAKAFRGELV